MSHIFPTDEQYEAELIKATKRHYERLVASTKMGCPLTLRQVDLALGDFMQDTQAWMEVITNTVAGQNPLQKVLADVMWQEAETSARAELAQREQQRPQNIAEDRAESRAWGRLLAMDHAYG